jgi:GntR family transcriptional regulator
VLVIEFRIDRKSGVAAYLQLVQQVTQALRLGLLQPGDQLPTVKEVVAATAINPNTVQKAYRELEHAGLVEARRGVGTFVVRSLGPRAGLTDGELRAGLVAWVERARAAGLEREDVEALTKSVIDELF